MFTATVNYLRAINCEYGSTMNRKNDCIRKATEIAREIYESILL